MTLEHDAPLSHREPLDDTDISELDYDEMPTAVALQPSRLKRDSIFPPPNPGNQAEVFSLIERHSRPSLMLVDESPIDFGDVLKAPSVLPMWDEEGEPALVAPRPLPPPLPAPTNASSIAPVALSSAPPQSEIRPIASEQTGSKAPYAAAIGALATVAAIVAMWTPARDLAPSVSLENAAPHALAVVQPATHEVVATPETRVLDLAEVRIVGAGPIIAADLSTPREHAQDEVVAAAPAADLLAPAVDSPALPAAEPAEKATPAQEPGAPSDVVAAAPEMPPVEAPAPTAPPFDRAAAASALSVAASRAAGCRELGTPSAQARVSVTFAASGKVAAVNVTGAYAGTPTGGCIAKAFRAVHVEAFDGAPVTVHRTFQF